MKKLLIIEDDQIVGNIYRNKFTVEGYQVEVAPDGETGIESLRSFKPDAVILDLVLPRMTGVELMRKIRADPETKNVPVVVFSNTYLTNMVQEAWKAGATKCLSKANCSPKQVVDVVNSVVGIQAPMARPAPSVPAGFPAVASPAQPVMQVSQPTTRPTVIATDQDAEFQADLRKSFINDLPGTLAAMRTLLQGIIKADSEATQLKHIHDLYRKVHSVTGSAGLTGLTQIAQMSDALEALLKALYEKPKNLNASTVRTVASAVDFLGLLFDQRVMPEKDLPAPNILVVDDEAISRRAVVYALERANLRCAAMEDPDAAYNVLAENRFDLIFLDVDMPGMNGFELCSKIRGLATNKKTPVVFVTSLNDFENRTQSTISGGNDFIAKPFLFMELAVKAMIFVLRRRMGM